MQAPFDERRGRARLAQALRDMMLDASVDPMHWPVDAMLAVLRRSPAHRDAQVDGLIGSLSLLQARIADRFKLT